MEVKTSKIYIIFLILSLITSAPPPKEKPKPLKAIVEESNPVFASRNNILSSFKRLQSSEQYLENSTSVLKFYDTYIMEEHELIIVPKNLPNNSYYEYWGCRISSNGINLDSLSSSCEILNAVGEKFNGSNCLSSFALADDNKRIKFTYNYTLYNTNILKIKVAYNKSTEDQILYKTEWVSIPFIGGFSFCNNTYIILFRRTYKFGLRRKYFKKRIR